MVDPFTPTPEQLDIEHAFLTTQHHLMIVARAGSAKTTTLTWLAHTHMSKKQLCCLAFNVAIAEQLRRDMPPNAQVATVNSLAFSALADRLMLRKSAFTIVPAKYRNILKTFAKAWPEDDERHDLIEEILNCINYARSQAFVPEGAKGTKLETGGITALSRLRPGEGTLVYQTAIEALREGIAQGMAGKIDLADQVYLAVILRAPFPRYNYVMVDEAQDLSPLDHLVVQQLTRGKRSRLIAVGDPLQSIYAFRGADPRSMDRLREAYRPLSLPLTVCFRCPAPVVEEARWRAQDLQVSSSPPAGRVQHWGDWTLDEIPTEALILCPRNAPLYTLGLRLVASGRHPFFGGDSMLQPIIRDIQRWTKDLPGSTPGGAVLAHIQPRLAKLSDEKAEAIAALVAPAPLGQTIARAQAMLKTQDDRLRLSTIHKAKGLGHPWVMLLDAKHLVHSDDDQQLNALYVGQTRSKSTLVYASSRRLEE